MIETRYAFIGNVDSGKSTLLSVLSTGDLDDGRGKMRKHISQYRHELESGRTSSISLKWKDKDKILIDLCGHERYLRTTIYGLNSMTPDYCILVIGSNMGISRMTREHIRLAIGLEIPIIICLTKTDICPKNVYDTTRNVLKRLIHQKLGKRIYEVKENNKNIDNIVLSLTNIPVIDVSNVTGEGIDKLNYIMNKLKVRRKFTYDKNIFQVDAVYSVPGSGLVVGGTMISGKLSCKKLYMGPNKNGEFKNIITRSYWDNDGPVKEIEAGMYATINIKGENRKDNIVRSTIKKGMILTDTLEDKKLTREFEAMVYILHHPTTIAVNYEPLINCYGIRQCAKIERMENDFLRSGDRCKCMFKFMIKSEYLCEGWTFIFREGGSKGVGIITKII